ncbi:MAG: hypothetical protein ACK4WM_09550 [Thermoflexales bacterium]
MSRSHLSLADLPVPARMKLLRDTLLPPVLQPSRGLPTYGDLLERLERLSGQLATVRQRAQIREQPFVSHAPIIGPLIIRLRYAWNWMSTKWWVLPMVAQQNRFNLELVNLLQDSITLVRQVIESTADMIATQQAEMARLREEIEALRITADRFDPGESSTRTLND